MESCVWCLAVVLKRHFRKPSAPSSRCSRDVYRIVRECPCGDGGSGAAEILSINAALHLHYSARLTTDLSIDPMCKNAPTEPAQGEMKASGRRGSRFGRKELDDFGCGPLASHQATANNALLIKDKQVLGYPHKNRPALTMRAITLMCAC
ncbi:hypothetical protein IRJ41_004855 [Triplophysa rosa]|uniref:Uncharacterized protein n=1 Tax=Triplophysa rosa TaxID=992332 RepID=A0A9W7TGP1_TRIRA|nr:hypothetical protein IRJ41_004855 [Triplophysa rosa]